jgi:small GTP-binding protein
VGKSSILLRYATRRRLFLFFLFFFFFSKKRFTDDTFTDKHAATIGVDFKTRDMNFKGRLIRATVWDTAGQEKFRSLTSSYYRGTHGIVLVYDVSNRDSFNHVNDWLNEISTYTSEDDCVMLLVGNKIDLEGILNVLCFAYKSSISSYISI